MPLDEVLGRGGGIAVRCFCVDHPLLAMCGRDEASGEPWVHVKTWKRGRLYAEVVATAGDVKIRCRDCLRWHTVRIVRGAPALLPLMQSPLEKLRK